MKTKFVYNLLYLLVRTFIAQDPDTEWLIRYGMSYNAAFGHSFPDPGSTSSEVLRYGMSYNAAVPSDD